MDIFIDILIIIIILVHGAYNREIWSFYNILDNGTQQILLVILTLVVIELIINVIYRILSIKKFKRNETELKSKEKEWKNLEQAYMDMQKVRDKEQDAQIKAIEKELEELKRARGR